MRLEFTLTWADLVAFNKIARSSTSRNWSLLIIIASTVAVLTLINWPTEFWKYLGPFQFAVQIGLFFLGLFVLRKVVRRKAEEKCDVEFSDSIWGDPITITFDEHGLTSEQRHQKTIFKWPAFRKVSVEHGDIYLWFGKLQAVMIPARSAGSEKKLEDLVEYLKARID